MITLTGLGAVNSTNGVLVKPICDSLGFLRGEFTLHRTIITLVGAGMLPFFGKICKQIGVKNMLIVSAVATGLITFSYSFATQLWHFYIIALFNGIFMVGPSFLTVGILISNWFDDKKGVATGLAYSGAGFGAALLVPIVGQIEVNYSWQTVYRFIGILILIVLVPTVVFLVKEKPQDMGLLPYRAISKKDENNKEEFQHRGIVLQQAVGTPMFWILMLAFFLLSIVAGAPNIHTVAFLSDAGYTTAFAALILSLMMIMHMLGNIFLGGFFDRFGMLIGSLFLGICCIVFQILIVNAEASANVYLFTLIYGVASSGFTVPATFFISKCFGSKDFSSIFSMITISTTAGTALAGPAMGLVYDVSGNYFGGWMMMLIFGIIITLCLLVTYFIYRKRAYAE